MCMLCKHDSTASYLIGSKLLDMAARSKKNEGDFSFSAANSISLSRNFIRSQPKPRRKCVYNVRLLKSRGALLVLVWNLLVFSYHGLALGTIIKLFSGISKDYPWKVVFATIMLQECLPFLIYPIAGWIADAKIGRYKVIKGSLWIMWIGAILLVIEEIVRYILNHIELTNPEDDSYTVPLIVVLYIINAIGIAGFQANLLPFGVDQMEDGSSDQYSAFIHWYYWTRNCSFGLVIQLAIQSAQDYCEANDNPNLFEPTDRYNLIILLLQVAFVSIALCLDLIFSESVLNKDPKTYNPIMKVWKISKFVAKNNRLVGYRRAITFTYDAPPQRTDFAKRLFGGPYEGDEVEDVKTFWKVLVFVFSLGLGGVFVNNTVVYTDRSFVDHMKQTIIPSLSDCSVRHMITELLYPLVITLAIPFYELFIYPFFRNYIPRMMKRVAIGMVLMVSAVLGLLVLDSIGHSQTSDAVCLAYHTHSHSETLAPIGIQMAYAIPFFILIALGELLTFIPALELIVAQAPFSMRGLLIGLFYAMDGIFTGLVGLLILVISLSFSDYHNAVRGLSCGSWLYLVTAVIGIVGIVLYFIAARWYKKRQRGGQKMVNHQAVIESYYETTDGDSD